MARTVKPLSAKKVESAKAREKKYKLSDGGGLFLQINPNGSKFWRLNYRLHGKAKEYAIGTLKDYSLEEAREERSRLRKLVNDGIDINQLKKKKKENSKKVEIKKENTFYNISQKWHKHYEKEVSEDYHIRLGRSLDNYIYPFIKDVPMDEVKRTDIIEILESLKTKGLHETAKRTATVLNKIYKYAVTYEFTPHNIIADIELKTILGKQKKKHYPTFTESKDIKGLLLAIADYSGDYTTKMALKLLPYVFVRSFNIRNAEWSEINFDSKLWIIPAEKMKTKIEFKLPLAHQAIQILEEVHKFSGHGQFVFPSGMYPKRALSDNTLISALRRMGYTKEEFVPHGFRSMFSTIAYEKANMEDGHRYTGEVIEALLAHKETNKIKGAYNRAEYQEPMRGLIQWYADYLDEVKEKK